MYVVVYKVRVRKMLVILLSYLVVFTLILSLVLKSLLLLKTRELIARVSSGDVSSFLLIYFSLSIICVMVFKRLSLH